jgi:hypothetical protein
VHGAVTPCFPAHVRGSAHSEADGTLLQCAKVEVGAKNGMQKRGQVLAALFTGLLVGAAATYALEGASQGRTVTTSVQTVTLSGTPTASAGSRLYEVTFKQSGDCTPTAYAAPWSITLGPWTVAEPPNATLPIDTTIGSAGPSYVNTSMITFSVPDWEYQYSIGVAWPFANPSGVITVNGGDVMVVLQGPATSCTRTTTAAG